MVCGILQDFGDFGRFWMVLWICDDFGRFWRIWEDFGGSGMVLEDLVDFVGFRRFGRRFRKILEAFGWSVGFGRISEDLRGFVDFVGFWIFGKRF